MPEIDSVYAASRDNMAARSAFKRKAFFIDERSLRRAKKALGVGTDADAVRASLEWVAEMEEFWRFMRRTRGKLRPGSVAEP